MKNIHLIPTDESLKKRGDLVQDKFGTIHIFTINDGEEYGKTTTKLHLYITSSEEIKEGDWALMFDDFGNLFLCDKPQQYLGIEKGHHLNKGLRKIILTTDPTLIDDGVQEIDDTFLEWFVENPTCEFVEVEADWILESNVPNGYTTLFYNITIPQEESKKCENCNQIIDKYGCACPKDSKQEQKQHLIDMMKDDEELGLYDVSKYVSSGGEKYVFGTAKGEYTIGITSPNTAKGEYGLAIGFNPETANTAYDHHSIVIGNGLTTTEPYQLLVDRNGIKIDKIMTMEEYELLSQVLKSINDIKF